MMSIVYGPKWPFYSCWDYIALFRTCICRFCIWVELPVQRRLCPIFVRNVRSPDIHECFRGLTGSQRTHGFGASQLKRGNCVLRLILVTDSFGHNPYDKDMHYIELVVKFLAFFFCV